MTKEPPAHLIDWHGNDWTPESGTDAAHPNSRYTVPVAQCPVAADEFHDPKGVPVSAMLFGGRRADTVPLVSETRDWNHGVLTGALLASGQTAAAEGEVGALRHDPMAMLPFIGYNVGDYLAHWLEIGKKEGAQLPRIYLVNWFRRGEDGRFLWPGFGDNSRVLKWITQRIEGEVEADETPAGLTARFEDLDLTGLDYEEDDIRESLTAPVEKWRADIEDNEQWLEHLGDRVPKELWDEWEKQKARLNK